MTKFSYFDCIVIGGGHNGLVAAAYLARAGKRVCVLERRHVLGGASVTEGLWPGFKVSTAAYVISLFHKQIIRDLQLSRQGLKILPRNPSSFTPLPDGRSLLLGPDAGANYREIEKFSRRDAEAFTKYEGLLERVAGVIEPLMEKVAPNPLPLPTSWRKTGLSGRLRDTGRLWEEYQRLTELGEDLPAALELLIGAARPLLERWFESETLRATLATDAVIGNFTSISAPGSAYVLLHHVMGEAGGARGVWGYVEGGMGGLATALEKACLESGVEIHRETPARRILTEGGKVRGVELAGGRVIEGHAVASTLDPHWTFEKLLSEDVLPAGFREAVGRIDYDSASAKINLALSEPPNFTCRPSQGIAPHHHGTMHIGHSLDYLEQAYHDARMGEPSREPILEITLPTSVDQTIAPPGQHIMSIFVQYAPFQLREGTWETRKEAFADRCVEVLAEYAPNVPGAVLHRQVISPLDLERDFGLTGGNIFQGAMTPHQLFSLRPVAGWADHRTPVKGLYLCGAASHPGGGVMGICGRNGAQEILRDM